MRKYHGKNNPNHKHGMCGTKPYFIWVGIRQRCNNKKCKDYKHYGGRGIKICNRWNKFFNFWEDMGKSYFDGATIERVDNDGDYTPQNCKWASRLEQSNNTRRSKRYGHDGKELTASEWEEITGINRHVISQRIDNYGWTVKEALEIPVGSVAGGRVNKSYLRKANLPKEEVISFYKKTHNSRKVADKFGVSQTTILSRLKKWRCEIVKPGRHGFH